MVKWYLYRSSDDADPAADMPRLTHSESKESLKAEARRMAQHDGHLDLSWTWGADSDQMLETEELWSEEACLFVVRSW